MTYLKLFSITFLIVGNLFSKDVKSLPKSNTSNEYEDIENPELQAELETLKMEFEKQRQMIMDRFEIQIDNLKSERKDKVNVVREDFAERRKALFKKYGVKRSKLGKVKSKKINQNQSSQIQVQPVSDLNKPIETSKKKKKLVSKKPQ